MGRSKPLSSCQATERNKDLLTGTTYQRSIEDLENQVLTYAQVKALALAEPLMKQLAEKENEVKNLKILLSRERQTLAEQKKELAQIDEKIKAARQRWETSIAAVDALKNMMPMHARMPISESSHF